MAVEDWVQYQPLRMKCLSHVPRVLPNNPMLINVIHSANYKNSLE